jgi:ATP-dependent helicase HrpB
MRDLATRWAKAVGGKESNELSAASVLALGYPERIARLRGATAGRFVMAGGRGAMLDETDPLARQQWLAVADMTGSGPDLRVTLAARMTEEEALASGAVETKEEAKYDPASRRVRARRTRRIGSIILEETPLPSPPADLIREALLEAIRENGFPLLKNSGPLEGVIHRIDLLGKTIGDPWPKDFRASLVERLNDWLGPLLDSPASLDALDGGQIADAALTLLDWPLPRDLARLAPLRWETPVGRSVDIDYAAEGGPRVECKVQEAYGLSVHPAIADSRIALTIGLLSPACRPVAVTKDLPAFWRGGYHDMRKDMKGRYPKHDWPEDPAAATPTSRARPRQV